MKTLTNAKSLMGTVLIIDDERVIREHLARLLQAEGLKTESVASLHEGIAILQQQQVELVFTDLRLGHESGLEVIRMLRQSFPGTESVVMTAFGSIEGAVEALHLGAIDYLTKPLTEDAVKLVVHKVIERKRLVDEVSRLRQHVAMNYGFDNIIGISKPMLQVKDTARRIAPTDITTLITGPSGTGKELFARAIHHHSLRRSGPFVAIDCSSIPEALLESELFGHVRGSFTSAWNNKKGLFEEAEGGTIFLDELSNMPISVQVKLLRFLQDGNIRPVGSNDQKKINARIVGASNRDLTEMVARGTFREDLYYRLNVIPLNLPPLRERREDIEMLTDYFLRRIAAEIGKAPHAITRRAIEKLLSHEWPGNVRELENTLKRGVALCQAEQLDLDDIMFIRNESTIEAPSFGMVPRGRLMDATQRQTILRALSDNNWNYTQTAQALGIGRTTLWRKMKKYELGSKGLDDAFGAEEMNESMVEELDEVLA